MGGDYLQKKSIDVLIVVTNYLDESVISSRRWRYLAEYLANHLYNVTIISHDGKKGDMKTEKNGVTVFSLRNDVGFISEKGGRLGKLIKYKNYLSLPFFAYYYYLERKEKRKLFEQVNYSFGKGMLRELIDKRYDLIISSVYNMDAFYISKEIKKNIHISRHICDVRDPLVHPFFGSKPQTMIGKCRLREINKEVDGYIACYDYIINEIKANVSLGNKELFTLTHAYKEYLSDSSNKKNCLQIASVGTYYPTNHDPHPLIDAILLMDEKRIISPELLKIVIAGRNSDLLYNCFCDKGLEEYVFDCGFVSHEEALALENNSDILLFLSFIEEVSAFSGVTGKFPEYLAMDKELLMVFDVRKNSHAQIKYFNDLSVGIAVDSKSDDSKQLIMTWLIKKLFEKQNGGVAHQPNMELVKEYDVNIVGKRLENIIDKVLSD